MRFDAVLGDHAEIEAAVLFFAGELHRGRNEHRHLELHRHGEGFLGQLVLQLPQGAGLGPHAVGDLAFEAEQLGGQRVEVDRVAVAGHGAVTAAGVAGDLPFNGVGDRFRGAARALVGLDAAAAAAEEVHRFAGPDPFAAGADHREDGKLVAFFHLGQVAQVAFDVELLALGDGAVLGDAVAHVHQAHGREREAVLHHQRHVQRKGVDVRVGDRQAAVVAEPADLAVGGQVPGVQAHIVEAQADIGQLRVFAGLHPGTHHRLGEIDRHRRGVAQLAEVHVTHNSVLDLSNTADAA